MDGVGNKRLPFDPRRGAPCVRVRALQSEDVSEVGWRERRFGSGRSRPTSCEEVNRLFHPASIGGTPPPPTHPVVHLLPIRWEKGGTGPSGVLTLGHSCDLDSLHQQENWQPRTVNITAVPN